MEKDSSFWSHRTTHKKWLPGLYDLQKIWHPAWFQGNRKRNNYFEGWYIKCVSKGGDNVMAFIPGISLSREGSHAFVQVINGISGETWYFSYPVESFRFSRKGFAVRIDGNYFSSSGIELDLQSDTDHIAGNLTFSEPQLFPVSIKRPGIMGWYRYAPFMECYHGVVSLDHHTDGILHVNNRTMDFNAGKGYIEKDWGSSMPESWIWMQSNHFGRNKTAFMLSVAKIPWLGKSFPGFLGFFLLDGKRTDFATYLNSEITVKEKTDKHVRLLIKGRDFTLEVKGEKGAAKKQQGALKAPRTGNMDRMIHESIDARLSLTMRDRSGNTVFEGSGKHAGLEMIGDIKLQAT